MRSAFIATCLLCALARPAHALDPIEPVPPPSPVAPEVQRAFDESFGADIRKVLATPDTADDADLAARLLQEARNRASFKEFAALACDHVVRLAGPCPGCRRLAYDALRMQKTEGLRPARPCLEKMMLVAPRVADELQADARAAWIRDVWAPDARELAELQIAARAWDDAVRALSAVTASAARAGVKLPPDFADLAEAAEFLRVLGSARERFEAEIAQPGDHPDAHVALGILSLTRDAGLDKARAHFNLSASRAARDMAAALDACARDPADTDAVLRLARASADLAAETKGAYLQVLLWKYAEKKLAASLAAGRLTPDQNLRAETLRDQFAAKAAGILDRLPLLVRKELSADPPSAPRPGPSAEFFGVGSGSGQRIAFVVDRSGSMTDSIMYVKHELKRSIRTLRPNQEFYVVFYSSGPPVDMPGQKLVPATEASKQQAYEFIDRILPVGRTDPSDALKRAFSVGADTIYFLTDGEFEKPVVGLIDQLNATRRVTISTICFIYTGGEPVMRQIAERNGGAYKFISENDLDKLAQ